ncbi:MAG: hypothetical protein EBY22_00825 [Gammaproteobacteria bacterium]|nr:hypothetical protein [Gammaproteobacteria bacterium]
MGIPSYFSHFVRQHRGIIKQIKLLNKAMLNDFLIFNLLYTPPSQQPSFTDRHRGTLRNASPRI